LSPSKRIGDEDLVLKRRDFGINGFYRILFNNCDTFICENVQKSSFLPTFRQTDNCAWIQDHFKIRLYRSVAKTKQTFNKRDKEIKKKNKRKEKEEKREARKSNSSKGKGFDSMIAYVDENGHLSSTPPDPRLRQELKLEDIQLGARKPTEGEDEDYTDKGRVSYYNEEKGYGFIKDSRTKESVFFHLSEVKTPVKLNDLVSFLKVRGQKGMNATTVTKTD
jgi:cold shock CspA family protein